MSEANPQTETTAHELAEGVKGFDRDTVVKIVNSVLSRLQKTDTKVKTALQDELLALHQIIQDLRGDISNIKATSIQHEEIPSATDELDAVIDATEEATGTIMDSLDTIESVTAQLDDENATKIADEVVKIYEACSFQDITGQRISKVVTALRNIEVKVDQLLSVVSVSFPGALQEFTKDSEEEGDGDGDAELLNGPALPENKVTQDDIDAILAQFD